NSFAPGFDVATARDPQQALAWIDTFPPDLLLTDLEFAEDGASSLRERLRLDARTRDCRVVVLSSLSANDPRVESVRLESDALLFHYQRLYSRRSGRFAVPFRVGGDATGATMAALALTFFYRGHSYSRATVLIFYPLVVTALVAARNLYRRYRAAVQSNPAARRRVLIVGFGRVGQHLGGVLVGRPSYYDLVGFLDD